MCRLCYKLLFKGGAVLTLLLMLGVFLPLAASAHSAYPAHTGSTGPSVAGPSQAVDCFNPHFGGASGTVGRMVAYIGSDLHIHIHDFTNNTDDRDPTQTTPTAPTITCQTVLVVIWKANDSSNKIFNGFYHCSDSSGTPPCGLHQVSAFNETTYTSPSVSAAPYGNCPIVLAWSGTDSQHHLYYKWANLGQLGSWSSTYKLTDYTWQDGGVSVTCDGTSS